MGLTSPWFVHRVFSTLYVLAIKLYWQANKKLMAQLVHNLLSLAQFTHFYSFNFLSSLFLTNALLTPLDFHPGEKSFEFIDLFICRKAIHHESFHIPGKICVATKSVKVTGGRARGGLARGGFSQVLNKKK